MAISSVTDERYPSTHPCQERVYWGAMRHVHWKICAYHSQEGTTLNDVTFVSVVASSEEEAVAQVKSVLPRNHYRVQEATICDQNHEVQEQHLAELHRFMRSVFRTLGLHHRKPWLNEDSDE